MPYAVVQKVITKPDVATMRQAFKTLPFLMDADADILANDGYGIIVDNLDLAQAQQTSGALNDRGILTQVVEESDIPRLPHPKSCRRLACTPDSLVLLDALGREQFVSWDSVAMVAAGAVTLSEFRTVEKTRVITRGTGWHGGSVPILLTDISHEEESRMRLVLNLFLTVQPVRLEIQAHEFLYNYLGDRLSLRYVDNFGMLVRDLTRYSRRALLNRGAESLDNDYTATLHYPTRHAFEEEIKWLLWTAAQDRK